MKGKIRKLLSVVVATAMTLSCLSVPALADDVSQQTEATMVLYSASANREYNAYQIFTGTYSKTDGKEKLSDVQWGTSVKSTALRSAVITALKADTLPDGSTNPIKSYFDQITTASSAEQVSNALSSANISNNSTNADALAAIFADTLKSNRATVAYKSQLSSQTLLNNNYKYEFGGVDGLVECGYYVIEDVTSNETVSTETSGYSKYILKVDGSGVSITEKTATGPTLSKTGTTNSDYTTGADTQLNAAIGDTVYFTLSSTVPDTSAYTKYVYVVNDKMTKGLDFNNDVVITVGDTTLTAGDKGANDYTLTTTENTDDGSTSLKIVFNDFANKWTTVGQTITIKYSATLNEDFVCGLGADNYNAADLTYSNNPNYQYKGTTDNPYEPDPEDPYEPSKTTSTPDSTVYVFSAALNLIKEDTNGNRLPDAEFTITGDNINTVLKVEDAFTPVGYATTYTPQNNESLYVKNADGTFTQYTSGNALEKDNVLSVVRYADENLNRVSLEGGYVKKLPNDMVEVANADLNDTKTYETDAIVYTLTQNVASEKKADATDGAIKLVLDSENASLTVEGLSAGTYTITETHAPNGYSLLLNPITVKISWSKATTLGDSCNWSYTVTSGDAESYTPSTSGMTLIIKNKSGAMLPTTGGIGTTIFYVAGTILVLGAAVALITRRRMKGEVK
jgi:fimbrial isopeptide formation D2 family protein/LPXTG-motif cell wall-anchored protein